MKEIGGYIEFEKYYGNEYHNGIRLNCGRICLAYLIEARNIKKIHLPYYLCSSVREACVKSGVEIHFYHINEDFSPKIDFPIINTDYFYLVNYYGQISNIYIENLNREIKNLIVDNSQAFFQLPVPGIDTLYTCRKFFGVADGAILYTDKLIRVEEQDESFERMHFLLGRYERSASEFYQEYVDNNHFFRNEPIKRMSKLTENLLHGIDYEMVKQIRTQNFAYLNEKLHTMNKLNLFVPDGSFMYPLYIENGAEIRKKLQANKVFIPTLWPAVFNLCGENELEYDMARNILPLPVDQRYGIEDMEYMIKKVVKNR